jgi:hypothetical protein
LAIHYVVGWSACVSLQIRVVTDKEFKDPESHKNIDQRLNWEKLSSDLLVDNRPGMDNRPVLKCPSGGKVLPSGIVRFYPRPASRAPRVSPQPPTPKALSSIVGGNADEPEVAVPFPNTSFSASGEALLGGKRPTMRFALRAVRLLKLPDSEEEEVVEIENIRGEVSSAFCVATKRTEHDAKAEVPTLDDPVRRSLSFTLLGKLWSCAFCFGPHACWKEDCCKGQLSCSPSQRVEGSVLRWEGNWNQVNSDPRLSFGLSLLVHNVLAPVSRKPSCLKVGCMPPWILPFMRYIWHS